MALLDVKDLKMYYNAGDAAVRAVDGISFQLEKGMSLGLAGESGCGKSSLALALLRLLPENGRIISGRVLFDERDVLALSDEEFRRKIRWNRMSMVFQGAMNALNPVLTVGDQIAEAIITNTGLNPRAAEKRVRELLSTVGISPDRYTDYPHELSGGMKQRAVIAMALACNPDLIIADEPTTALDVMVQAQILKAMQELCSRFNLSMILISHDLSVIAQVCDYVAIMYAGQFVEYGRVIDVFENPLHPYTAGLLSAFPDIKAEKSPIKSLPGLTPDLAAPPAGCRFHPRCPGADRRCQEVPPDLTGSSDGHLVACHNPRKIRW